MYFMFDPIGFIVEELASKQPKVALATIGALGIGTKKAVLASVAAKMYKDSRGKAPKSRLTRDLKKMAASLSSIRESVLVEQKISGPTLKKFLNDPRVREALRDSSLARELNKKTGTLAQSFLGDIQEKFGPILNADSFDELSQITRHSINNADMRAEPGEEAAVQSAVLEQAKQEVKKKIIDQIGDHLEQLGLADDKEHPYHAALLSALEKFVS
jgi:hypothetical protein